MSATDPRMAWQPIETAPRDGAAILLAFPGATEPEIGRWHVHRHFLNDRMISDSAGWYVAGKFVMVFEKAPEPLFWMPLPALPALPPKKPRARIAAEEIRAMLDGAPSLEERLAKGLEEVRPILREARRRAAERARRSKRAKSLEADRATQSSCVAANNAGTPAARPTAARKAGEGRGARSKRARLRQRRVPK